MTYLVGVIIGSVLGLTGAGGSVFAVPLLLFLLHLPLQSAIGISLGAVAVSSLFGTMTRLLSSLRTNPATDSPILNSSTTDPHNSNKQQSDIQWLPALIFAIFGAVFSPIGNYLNQFIDSQWLLGSFSVLVLIVASRMWRDSTRRPEITKAPRASFTSSEINDPALCRNNENQPFKFAWPCIAGAAAGASLAGLLSGLFGVGGGFIIVPTLIYLTGINIKQAVATSLVIISIISTSGFIAFITRQTFDNYDLLLQVSTGGILGMLLGLFASKKLAGPTLQKTFSVAMFLMAGLSIYKSFSL